MSDAYDWADDDFMSAEEIMRRFVALQRAPTHGPSPRNLVFVVEGGHACTL
jgi:hypothetical protein